jgi:hypothetical protein
VCKNFVSILVWETDQTHRGCKNWNINSETKFSTLVLIRRYTVFRHNFNIKDHQINLFSQKDEIVGATKKNSESDGMGYSSEI